jgi:hypothetical protein
MLLLHRNYFLNKFYTLKIFRYNFNGLHARKLVYMQAKEMRVELRYGDEENCASVISAKD